MRAYSSDCSGCLSIRVSFEIEDVLLEIIKSKIFNLITYTKSRA